MTVDFGISCICAVKLYVNLQSLSTDLDLQPGIDLQTQLDLQLI